MIAKHKPVTGNNFLQVYYGGNGFIYVHPIPTKSTSGLKLGLLYDAFGIIGLWWDSRSGRYKDLRTESILKISDTRTLEWGIHPKAQPGGGFYL